jgi:hypothetical protein
MRKLLHDQLLRRLFLTSGTALGGAVLWHCSTSPNAERTGTVASAINGSLLTQHNDNARTGANLAESTLTPSNVSTQFGYLYDLPVQGVVYAQPLVVANVTINGTLYPSVVYVVTMHNMVYAFDGTASTPTQVLPPVMLETPTAAQDTTIGNCNCFPNCASQSTYTCPGPPGHQPIARATSNNIPGEIGILSTPVIVNQTMYLITNSGSGTSTSTGGNHHYLHALDIRTLQDISTPQRVTHPDGSTFPSNMQIQRPALLAASGKIYSAFGSYCDVAPYSGWVIGLDQATLRATSEWESNPTSSAGGIWQSGQGPAADSSGNVYVLTGNGYNDNDTNIVSGGTNAADTMVELGPNLGTTPVSWFVPSNYSQLGGGADLDFGSGGVLLLSSLNPPLALGGGKFSTIYAAPQNNLGKFVDSGTPPGVTPLVVSSSGHYIKGSPVYWNGPGGPHIYVWAAGDVLRTFHYNAGTSNFDMPSQSTAPAAVDPGGMLSISANGSTNGILWAARTTSSTFAVFCPQPGSLVAFDANNVNNVLWDSAYEVAAPGFVFSKNAPPTVANGRAFVSTFGGIANIGDQPPTQGYVRVFGLGAPPLGFGASTAWFTAPFYGSAPQIADPTQLADVNGDGKADAVAFNGSNIYVMTSNGSGFNSPALWSSTNPFYGTHDTFSTQLADVNGDGKADAVAFDGSSVYVMLSSGSGFGASTIWSGPNIPFYGSASQIANPTQLADVNGDGKADAVAFNGSNIYVMLSNGSGFNQPILWPSTNPFYGTHDTFSTQLADVNGDGKADAVAFDGSSVYVMLSSGSGFGASTQWSNVQFYGTAPQAANPTQLADVNGDGKADAVAFNGSSVYVMLSNGSGFNSPIQWSGTLFYGTHDTFSTQLGDVNGDHRADAVAFDGSYTYVMLGVR